MFCWSRLVMECMIVARLCRQWSFVVTWSPNRTIQNVGKRTGATVLRCFWQKHVNFRTFLLYRSVGLSTEFLLSSDDATAVTRNRTWLGQMTEWVSYSHSYGQMHGLISLMLSACCAGHSLDEFGWIAFDVILDIKTRHSFNIPAKGNWTSVFAGIFTGDDLKCSDSGFCSMFENLTRVTVAIEVAYTQREVDVIQKAGLYLDAPNNHLRLVICIRIEDLREDGFRVCDGKILAIDRAHELRTIKV